MSKIILKNVRLSFPSLWSTESYNGTDTGKYACTFLIEKDTEQGKAVTKAVKDAMKEVGAKADKTPLKDGDNVKYDGYAGMWAIKANTKKRPLVLDKDKTPLTEEDGVIYAGCYVNASIEVYSMDGQYGKRVGCQLNGVQFAKDGESFGGGGGNAIDDFDAVEDDSSDEENPFG